MSIRRFLLSRCFTLLQVIAITLWITVSTWLFVFCAMMLLVPYIPFLATINQQHVGSIVSLAAMLMVARSPASAVTLPKIVQQSLIAPLLLFANGLYQLPPCDGLFVCLQIAVVKETGGKGPYCSLILAVVVMKDVLVFVCFAVNVEFTRMVCPPYCEPPTAGSCPALAGLLAAVESERHSRCVASARRCSLPRTRAACGLLRSCIPS